MNVSGKSQFWVVALVLTLVLAACAPGGPEPAPETTPAATGGTDAPSDTTAPEGTTATSAAPADGGETVKVGFISPTTGFVAALGIDMQRGWEMYWDEHGTTAGGVTVQTVFEDDAGDPDIALTKARRLVEEEQVDIVTGPILANTAAAVAEYVAGEGIPSLHTSAADDMTQRNFDPLVLRVAYTGSQATFPAGQWAYEQGYRTAVTLCPDYAFGWESCGGFVSAFTEAGGEITDQVWHPLGTQDFSSFVTQIQAGDPDVVFIASAGGADAIQLWSSWADFGMVGTPTIANCCFTDQIFLREVGEEAVGSVQSFSYWVEGSESEVVQSFVAAYEEAHGEIPSLYSAGSYMAAEIVAEALEATGGQVNGAEFIEAARGVSLDSLWGPMEFDDYNNVVGPIYQMDVVAREDGTLWNVVGETFEGVSQFWNSTPEEFLANPSFSTDYQGN